MWYKHHSESFQKEQEYNVKKSNHKTKNYKRLLVVTKYRTNNSRNIGKYWV